jgi:hypothetical protein
MSALTGFDHVRHIAIASSRRDNWKLARHAEPRPGNVPGPRPKTQSVLKGRRKIRFYDRPHPGPLLQGATVFNFGVQSLDFLGCDS